MVEPHPGAGFTYVQLIHNAQTQVYEGIGGRKDLVHDIKEEWDKEQTRLSDLNTTQEEIWGSFTAHYKKELKRLDTEGFITKHSESARSIIPPEQASVNQSVEHRLSGLSNQLDTLAEQNARLTEENAHLASAAMSVISNNQHRAFNATAIPSYIQTDPTAGNTSMMGSETYTDAQCKRMLNEQQINHGKQVDALNLQNQQLLARIQALETGSTMATTVGTSRSGPSMRHLDQSSMKKDAQGRKWYQVKFCCSKHGFNTSHSNDNCNGKHMNKGHPWIPGASLVDTKGGNNNNSDKLNYWYKPRTKQYLPQPPV